MTEKRDEKELDALKAHIACWCDEVAALATGVKKFAETKAADPHAEGEHEASKQGDPANGGHGMTHGRIFTIRSTKRGSKVRKSSRNLRMK